MFSVGSVASLGRSILGPGLSPPRLTRARTRECYGALRPRMLKPAVPIIPAEPAPATAPSRGPPQNRVKARVAAISARPKPPPLFGSAGLAARLATGGVLAPPAAACCGVAGVGRLAGGFDAICLGWGLAGVVGSVFTVAAWPFVGGASAGLM